MNKINYQKELDKITAQIGEDLPRSRNRICFFMPAAPHAAVTYWNI